MNAIAIDRLGRVWAGTEYGLSCVNPETNSVINHFLATNPLGDTYSEKACVTQADGSIVFGTHLGMVRIWPGEAAAEQTGHRTYITSVAINGENHDESLATMADGMPLSTPYDMNTLRFNFSNFRYSDIRSVQYQYYLEGLEEDWNAPTGDNSATYTKLPPGTYRLHVRSNDGSGHWGGEASMGITVRQPWWNSTAAWAAYVAAMMAVALVLRRIWILRKRLEIERSVTELKINFFTNVTHELTLPLTLIRAAVDQIVDAGREQPSATTLRTIVNNTARLGHMVEKLIQFRKISKATLTPTPTAADFVATVRNVCHGFWGMAAERGVRIRVSPFAKSHEALFDTDMVETVVGNLVSNAVKHSPNGGEVTVAVRRADGRLTVDVMDDGHGVDDADRTRLFAPYTGMKTNKGGLGIGLYISRQTALAMGGELDYTRPNGGRSTFRLSVPDVQPDDGGAHGGASKGERDAGMAMPESYIKEMMPVPMNPDITTIIAEDDLETLNYLRFTLGQYFNIATAGSDDEAVRLAADTNAHLVVAEKSAQTNGTAIAAGVRKACGQRTHTLIITSDGSDNVLLAAIRAGADGVMVRPFTMKMLTEACLRSVKDAAEWRTREASEAAANRPAIPTKAVIRKEDERRFIDAFNRILAAHAVDTDFTADRFAELMGMGRGRFYRMTGELTGETPATHILKARMEHVARMLRDTDKAVKDIMAEAGFANPTHFYNTFRKHFGMSPGQYRKSTNFSS